jgi:hypothetical protein
MTNKKEGKNKNKKADNGKSKDKGNGKMRGFFAALRIAQIRGGRVISFLRGTPVRC